MRRSKTSAALTPKRELSEENDDLSQSRPKRRATNAHIFRYLQHGNPGRLQDQDLRRALEASLEDCPDFFPAEDTASCSSSDHSNAPSASSGSSGTGSGCNISTNGCSCSTKGHRSSLPIDKRDPRSVVKHNNECDYNCSRTNFRHPTSMAPQCPIHGQKRPKVSVHNRYKPVAKKNIYHEADFFHEGIMDYIHYELQRYANRKARALETP